MRDRLDKLVVQLKLTDTRSQAESWIRLGKVEVDGIVVTKPGQFVDADSRIKLTAEERYVSRAGLKLASVAKVFGLDFDGKIVLDVGSSTGGFTDFALQHGARSVIAVDVGTDQMHPKLREDRRVELHEKTDIREFWPDNRIDIVVIDVSFISVRQILNHILEITSGDTLVVAMVKPQFEASRSQLNSSGIVKNDKVRREILQQVELWLKQFFLVESKADSAVAGTHGNKERFYLLRPITARS